ncbi:MAG: hypothetical protein QOC98_3124, partial [Frankiaceae bacterium]|nr:hypothetical protein [Frankiaceae bacterium]
MSTLDSLGTRHHGQTRQFSSIGLAQPEH